MSSRLASVVRDADSAELRRAYGAFPSGVTAVCGLAGGEPFGMAASSFTSVSLEPPLVSVCVNTGSRTLEAVRAAGRVGLSVLAEGQAAVCSSLAGAGDRFADVAWSATDAGAVFIEGASAWLDCSVHDVVEAGDHQILLLRVHGHHVDDVVEPLVFHRSRFRSLLAS